MIRVGKDELICDFAETYHIIELRSLRPSMLATLAAGLRENSRIKMKIAGTKIDLKDMLLASITDKLGILLWKKTKDGNKGINPPKLVVSELTMEKEKEIVGYSSGADFLKERERLLNGGRI